MKLRPYAKRGVYPEGDRFWSIGITNGKFILALDWSSLLYFREQDDPHPVKLVSGLVFQKRPETIVITATCFFVCLSLMIKKTSQQVLLPVSVVEDADL